MASTLLQFRCPEETKEKVKKLAEADSRKVANYLITMIDREYAKLEKANKAAK